MIRMIMNPNVMKFVRFLSKRKCTITLLSMTMLLSTNSSVEATEKAAVNLRGDCIAKQRNTRNPITDCKPVTPPRHIAFENFLVAQPRSGLGDDSDSDVTDVYDYLDRFGYDEDMEPNAEEDFAKKPTPIPVHKPRPIIFTKEVVQPRKVQTKSLLRALLNAERNRRSDHIKRGQRIKQLEREIDSLLQMNPNAVSKEGVFQKKGGKNADRFTGYKKRGFRLYGNGMMYYYTEDFKSKKGGVDFTKVEITKDHKDKESSTLYYIKGEGPLPNVTDGRRKWRFKFPNEGERNDWWDAIIRTQKRHNINELKKEKANLEHASKMYEAFQCRRPRGARIGMNRGEALKIGESPP